jgi:predicted ester cyclase
MKISFAKVPLPANPAQPYELDIPRQETAMPDPSDYPKLAQDAFNRRAPDFRYDAPGGESTTTREASLARERVLFRAFPDLRSDLGRNAALGATLVIEGVLAGTHRGAIRLGARDIPPTGRAVRIEFVGVFRFENGLARSERVYYDRLALLQQLGVTDS